MSKRKHPSKKSINLAIGKLSDFTPMKLSLGKMDRKISFKDIIQKRLTIEITLDDLKPNDLTKLISKNSVQATPRTPDIPPPPPPPSPEKRKRQSTRKNKETQIKSVDIIRISKEGRR